MLLYPPHIHSVTKTASTKFCYQNSSQPTASSAEGLDIMSADLDLEADWIRYLLTMKPLNEQKKPLSKIIIPVDSVVRVKPSWANALGMKMGEPPLPSTSTRIPLSALLAAEKGMSLTSWLKKRISSFWRR